MSDDNKPNTEKESTIKSRVSDKEESLLPLKDIATVHADKVMVAVDNSTQTATVTLLTMHAIPKLSQQFDIADYVYELVGEIKIPFAEMDILAIYYLTTRTH